MTKWFQRIKILKRAVNKIETRKRENCSRLTQGKYGSDLDFPFVYTRTLFPDLSFSFSFYFFDNTITTVERFRDDKTTLKGTQTDLLTTTESVRFRVPLGRIVRGRSNLVTRGPNICRDVQLSSRGFIHFYG